MTTLFESQSPRPLADRLRPTTIDEVVGQDHLTGPDGFIGRAVKSGRLTSIVFWGPPGTGKTTLARLLADHVSLHFEPLSAVSANAVMHTLQLIVTKVYVDVAKVEERGGVIVEDWFGLLLALAFSRFCSAFAAHSQGRKFKRGLRNLLRNFFVDAFL